MKNVLESLQRCAFISLCGVCVCVPYQARGVLILGSINLASMHHSHVVTCAEEAKERRVHTPDNQAKQKSRETGASICVCYPNAAHKKPPQGKRQTAAQKLKRCNLQVNKTIMGSNMAHSAFVCVERKQKSDVWETLRLGPVATESTHTHTMNMEKVTGKES